MFRRYFALMLVWFCLALPALAKTYVCASRTLTCEPVSINGREYISLYDAVNALGGSINWDESTRHIEARLFGHTFRFLPSSSAVLIDGDDVVHLPGAVTMVQGNPLLSPDFLTVVLPPYAGKSTKSSTSGAGRTTIVIDAGHGGKDTGALGSGLREKDLTLDVAKRVRDLLRDKGFRVLMTRERDVFLELTERSDIANAAGAAVFVSIHVNDAPDSSAAGTETFYLSKVQTNNDYHARRLDNSSYGSSLKARWSSLTSRMRSTFRQQHYATTQQQSQLLAQRVQRRLAAAAGGANRGTKGRNLSVLRNSYCPSCLVEIGFISNWSDVKKMKSSNHKQKVAKAIAQGIQDYLQ